MCSFCPILILFQWSEIPKWIGCSNMISFGGFLAECLPCSYCTLVLVLSNLSCKLKQLSFSSCRDKYIHTATRTARPWWLFPRVRMWNWLLFLSWQLEQHFITPSYPVQFVHRKMRCWKHGSVIPTGYLKCSLPPTHDTFDMKSVLHFELAQLKSPWVI